VCMTSGSVNYGVRSISTALCFALVSGLSFWRPGCVDYCCVILCINLSVELVGDAMLVDYVSSNADPYLWWVVMEAVCGVAVCP
jgi:hypothetical protein